MDNIYWELIMSQLFYMNYLIITTIYESGMIIVSLLILQVRIIKLREFK